MKKDLEKLLSSLLEKLEVTPDSITVTKEEETFSAKIELSEQDTGIMIGYHGDTISALQLMVNLILFKTTGEWQKVVIDIGDYREKRNQSLEKTAEDTAKRVKFSSEPIALFNLNPYERRTIHMLLEKNPDVITQSEGEGRNRHLVVSPKDGAMPPIPEDDHQPQEEAPVEEVPAETDEA